MRNSEEVKIELEQDLVNYFVKKLNKRRRKEKDTKSIQRIIKNYFYIKNVEPLAIYENDKQIYDDSEYKYLDETGEYVYFWIYKLNRLTLVTADSPTNETFPRQIIYLNNGAYIHNSEMATKMFNDLINSLEFEHFLKINE